MCCQRKLAFLSIRQRHALPQFHVLHDDAHEDRVVLRQIIHFLPGERQPRLPLVDQVPFPDRTAVRDADLCRIVGAEVPVPDRPSDGLPGIKAVAVRQSSGEAHPAVAVSPTVEPCLLKPLPVLSILRKVHPRVAPNIAGAGQRDPVQVVALDPHLLQDALLQSKAVVEHIQPVVPRKLRVLVSSPVVVDEAALLFILDAEVTAPLRQRPVRELVGTPNDPRTALKRDVMMVACRQHFEVLRAVLTEEILSEIRQVITGIVYVHHTVDAVGAQFVNFLDPPECCHQIGRSPTPGKLPAEAEGPLIHPTDAGCLIRIVIM